MSFIVFFGNFIGTSLIISLNFFGKKKLNGFIIRVKIKITLKFLDFDNVKDKKFLIQVNTGKESSKSGVMPNEAKDFIRYCVNELKLNIIGLMCMPPIAESPKLHFALLQKIAIENNINQLSMGMSNDYVEAVMLNATYIRLGTILFGKRK